MVELVVLSTSMSWCCDLRPKSKLYEHFTYIICPMSSLKRCKYTFMIIGMCFEYPLYANFGVETFVAPRGRKAVVGVFFVKSHLHCQHLRLVSAVTRKGEFSKEILHLCPKMIFGVAGRSHACIDISQPLYAQQQLQRFVQ